jgi:hypothetical protein
MHARTYFSEVNDTAAITYLTSNAVAADIRYNASLAGYRETSCFATEETGERPKFKFESR